MTKAKQKSSRPVRRSISLAQEVDRKVRGLAVKQRQSTNRVLAELVEAGLAAKEEERRRFFETAEKFRAASSLAEAEPLKQELAKMIFGN